MRKVVAVAVMITALLPQPSAARRMEKVLNECSAASPLPKYIDCIRTRYSKVGNSKRSGPTGAFYALLDEIAESYEASRKTGDPMSETKGRSNVYRAWQSTIEASNVGETGKICSMGGTTLVCQ